ncbi:hypothetical protein C8J55DRAFT_510645 [Lentinula edodes]|uniref:Mid2 domain-containing protein n=1 Tax=Lentinula lateritia TaxID=40482 RepID=A0A9W9AH23_9AGAR|nr:hypothetical protein C8J55DRAFT_510645 [Lentinula edodes]
MHPLFLLFAIFASCIEHTFAQSINVTLWQFGAHRLAGGEFTAPLLPIGTPSDGLSTTFLYEVLDPVTTLVTEYDSPVLTVSVTSVLRTIVASASGWIESFGPGTEIQCNFVSSDIGECFDATQTNTGAPTPVVLGVAATATSTPNEITLFSTTSATPPTSNSIPSPTGTISTTSTTSRKSSLGAIVGGTIAGVLVGCLFVILIFWLLRRQRRSRSISDLEKTSGSFYTRPRPYAVTVPPVRKDLPPLTSRVVPSAGVQTSTENSISEAANSDHLEEPTQADLRKQTQSAREELRSLHQAFLNTPMDISVRGGMINILERLRRLEEQASVNESPPAYMC